ncbi:alanine--tRNA ligase [Paenibacillus baekrokdamisoli]|uniref:Alanine--tRNA ligase n=1 Tax=Paenibacillus baekrokdamisoli TaxID=1712516 RepID=A0A3G9J096_9BACL|nr:alanine--tRNA ligase [Paenibacillus baekrokdamisoli]MBB3067504.1 alanyl-tRNA synthetase [Paenibacillus baekrokdamisoli]BBH19311.1 alanine--tRNA ligase [Paenibacillus baekrokdamisoli]
MKASEIRSKWLTFFESKGHIIEPSASLVPHNDPSLLWINAGMAPLKAYFDGRVKPENPRIANSQKCIRTNDIENVGKTRRHHTFFEMLGNFSIGDYFKEEIITWAWEFMTDPKWIGFDPNRLSVTVYPEDEEAYRFWNEKIGLPAERIYKLEENFWDIGEGPCGPCTEIFYDRGDKYGDLSDPECWPGGENERFLEVWNLVFSQYNHNKDGSYTPLPNKNIDTGAGLERFASILQDVDSNFDTDLFQPLILQTSEITGFKYHVNEEHDIAFKVIADHIRTVAFAVGDGVMPSNEGRGYVIRRLLRRAVRYGKTLGIDRPFLHELVKVVGDIMGGYYPEVVEKREFIEKVIRTEEERFHETLSDGLALLADLVTGARSAGQLQISGQDAFKLYDTFGFPFDLTEDYASEHGMTVDRPGFDSAMEEQRERARAARQDTGSMNVQGGALADFTTKSAFIGYEDLVTEGASIIAIIDGDALVDTAAEGSKLLIVLDRTPFYAESGGQVGDSGIITGQGFTLSVENVTKAPHGQPVHHATVTSGTVHVGDLVQAAVTTQTREDTIKNHTATHLLHRALKDVLGEHVNQAGSLVEPDRLRFDFSHFGSISAEELVDIERRVNEQIWRGTQLTIGYKSLAEAKAMGAMALFGEKYGDIVRVVQVGDYSLELCGGCHVTNTAQIGLFKLIGESGIGSGVRRIEAVTGRNAYLYMEGQLELLKQAAALLKANVSDVPKRIESLYQQVKDLGRENESLQGKLSRIEAGSLESQAKTINGITVLSAEVQAPNMDALRGIVDELKAKLTDAIIVLGAVAEDKVNLVVAVSPGLVKQGFNAGKIIKEAAAACGGGGGGRPDMAQAGGKDPAKLKEALQIAEMLVLTQANVI